MPENEFDVSSIREALNYRTALNDSYNFYHTDVEPRRLRERNSIQNAVYTNTTPIEETKIGVGDTQATPGISGNNTYTGNFTSSEGYHTGRNGVVISPSLLGNVKRLAQTITHEFAHDDQIPNRKASFLLKIVNAYTFNGTEGLTHTESLYLRDAYGLPSEHKDYGGESEISEMHATNRELRHNLQQRFKDQYGRDPENIEELDSFINNFSNEELLQLLKDQNGYGLFYGGQYVTGQNGEIITNFTNEDEKANKIKQALIHVAANQKTTMSNQNTAFAKKGQKLNYIKFYK